MDEEGYEEYEEYGEAEEEEAADPVYTEMYSPQPKVFPTQPPPGHTCPICLDTFDPNTPGVSPMCGNKHIFHPTCLSNWLERSTTCPLCRQ